jgi:hypothetical protein
MLAPTGKVFYNNYFNHTGILTHINNNTKVVRKFKKVHDGNYYEVIDDIVEGEAPK